MEENNDLGNLIRRCGANKINTVIYVIFVVITIGIGIFLMALPAVLADSDNYPIGDNGHVFYLIGIAVVAFGVVYAVVAYALTPKEKYFLYENGIVTDKGVGKTTLKYGDIEDVYVFFNKFNNFSGTVNTIAFRKDIADEWKIISPRFGKSAISIMNFLELYTAKRADVLIDTIRKNQSVKFKYIDAKTYIARSLFMGNIKRFLNIKTKEIIMTKENMVTETDTIDFKMVYTERNSLNYENFKLMDKNTGKTVLNLQYSSVFSPSVFERLLTTSLKRE